jgi:hypothetical protein
LFTKAFVLIWDWLVWRQGMLGLRVVMEAYCCCKGAWKCKSELCSQSERRAAASYCPPVINKRSGTREKLYHA